VAAKVAAPTAAGSSNRPCATFEYRALDVNRTDFDGMARDPDGPGRAVRLDGPAIERATLLRHVIDVTES